VQRIERTESQSGESASAFRDCAARLNGNFGSFEPQPSSQTPILTRVPLVLEIVSRRAYELHCTVFDHLQDRSDRDSFSSDSVGRRVVEGALEAADIQVSDRSHGIIVLPVDRVKRLLSFASDSPLKLTADI
jgi:hypothetical protein